MNLKLRFRFLIYGLPILVLSACSDDVDTPVTVSGTWRTSEYTQIHTAKDLVSGNILWTDTIAFGNTEFEFRPCTVPCVINPMYVSSENMRTLQGSWMLDEEEKKISALSLVNAYMSADTLINGHSYTFDRFMNAIEFEVLDVKKNRMILQQGTLLFVMTRKN